MDCGNWVKFLLDKYPDTRLKWITRELSTYCYGFSNDDIKKMNIEYDFSSIENQTFDAIFLCRSDTWLPPHLDKYFDELANEHLVNHFFDVQIENCVKEPRDIQSLVETQLIEMLQKYSKER
jgi:hypothetical protein